MALTNLQKEELLNFCKDMRVTDVRDGMDWCGYHHYGSMSPQMRPLWRTRTMGFANTARYIPYDRPVPPKYHDEYTDWVNWYYGNICIYPFMKEIQPYDFCVIDMSGLDVGLMGSCNTMEGMRVGCVGYIADGGVRDTDEVIKQNVPFWSMMVSQPMDQGRIQYESHNTRINCGGVCVNPGDFVVADGDGVIVVPQDMVFDVAKFANQEMRNDKKARRQLYVDLKLPLDESVDVE